MRYGREWNGLLAAALLSLWCWGGAARGAEPADVAVVCPDGFRQALAPWIKHRIGQGRRIQWLSNLGTAEQVRARIRETAKGGALRFVVLVGDSDPRMSRDPQVRERCVPAHLEKARVNVRWGSEPEIATDNWYADLNDDDVPDVAIGRLSAESPESLGRIVAKILAYEADRTGGAWRTRIELVAGVGGFGPLVDLALENSAKHLICDGFPTIYHGQMTYGSWQSPYFPDPRRFSETATERLGGGCLFWVYIGHGQRRELDWVRTPKSWHSILTSDQAARLKPGAGSPIALFLACYTGAFDDEKDCLSETLLRGERGPVAVISSSRVAMPYGLAVLSGEMIQECLSRHCETVGEILLHAKQKSMASVEKGEAGEQRRLLDALAGLLTPGGLEPALERREHLSLMNLLGDPLLRVQYPQNLSLSVPREGTAGEVLSVEGVCTVDGECRLELIVPRGKVRNAIDPRRAFPNLEDEQALAGFQTAWRDANDPVVVEIAASVRNGRLRARLPIPAKAAGAYHVRGYVQNAKDFAAGAADVKIVPAKNNATTQAP